MKKECYRDPYGCTASIKLGINRDGYVLCMYDPYGTCFHKDKYDTYHGARIALGKLSGGMMELNGEEAD